MIPLLVDAGFRVSIVTGLALLAMVLLRRRSAAVRHWVLTTAIVCALALPALQLVVPRWSVAPRLPLPLTESVPQGLAATQNPITGVDSGSLAQAPDDNRASRTLGGLVWIWLAGAAVALTFISIGFARLTWLASRSKVILSGRWYEAMRKIGQDRYGLRRPVRLLQSDHPTLLVTWGALTPRVLLPASAEDWPEDRIRVVLSHELAHIQRGDWAFQITAELLRAVHWFNPLVWLMCKRLREESERACDDAVLNAGIEGPAYATHLLELARGFAMHRATWSPAPAIAHPSHLERRVRAMLNPRLNRRPMTHVGRFTIALMMGVMSLPIAALAQTTFSTFSGTVLDPMQALLSGARMILTNVQTDAKYEVRSDPTGRFEFVGLPPADYVLEARQPGFETLRGRVTISGQDVQQTITLDVGTLEETITVTDGGTAPQPQPSRPAVALRKRPLPACDGAPVAGTLGGRIRPPVKIRDVRPIFPTGVPDAKGEEIVHLDARIATDGSVKEVSAIPPAHPVYADAAIEAVRQWQFDETLLNCVPVEVTMKVQVSFRRE